MITIGITGNIASGKTQVEKIVSDSGFKVIDADKISHFIMENDKTTINEIIKEFKNDDIEESPFVISRTKLGDIVFSDNNKKQKLENIIHKRIFKEIDNFKEKNKHEKIIFISMALLFETCQETSFNKIIFISSDKNLRLERLIKRNNLSEEKALARINSQMSEEEKIKKSDYIILNNSDLINLEKQTKLVIKDLIDLYIA